ncbi:MAG: hypothetical protein ACREHG_10455, partial [Candidatus Saccharimonadales bacterium]
TASTSTITAAIVNLARPELTAAHTVSSIAVGSRLTLIVWRAKSGRVYRGERRSSMTKDTSEYERLLNGPTKKD